MFIHTNKSFITSFYIKRYPFLPEKPWVSADPQFYAQRVREGVNRSGAWGLNSQLPLIGAPTIWRFEVTNHSEGGLFCTTSHLWNIKISRSYYTFRIEIPKFHILVIWDVSKKLLNARKKTYKNFDFHFYFVIVPKFSNRSFILQGVAFL